MSINKLKSTATSLSPDVLGYIAIVLSFVIPFLAIPVAVVARRRARAAGAYSTPAEWGWILSISISVLMVLVSIFGFIASVLLPGLT